MNAQKAAQNIAKQMISLIQQGKIERAHVQKFGGNGIPVQVRDELVKLLNISQARTVGLLYDPMPGLQQSLVDMVVRRERQAFGLI